MRTPESDQDRVAGADHSTAPFPLWPISRRRASAAARIADQRRLLRAEVEPRQGRSRRSSSPANTPRAASGWTAGNRGAAGRPATTGASSRSACAGVVRGVNVDTQVLHRQLSRRTARSTRSTRHGAGRADAFAPAEGDRRGHDPAARSPLEGDGDNFLAIDDDRPWTHLRLNIFPDGGVARLRVYGDAVVDWRRRRAARARPSISRRSMHGGLVVGASDKHYGAPQQHDHAGPRDEHGRRLGDEAAARARATTGRSFGSARRAIITKVEIDTNHFKGNYPDSASIEGLLADGSVDASCCRKRSCAPITAISSRRSCGGPARCRTCG